MREIGLSEQEQEGQLRLLFDEAKRRAIGGRLIGDFTRNLDAVLRETGHGLLLVTPTEEWPEWPVFGGKDENA